MIVADSDLTSEANPYNVVLLLRNNMYLQIFPLLYIYCNKL